MKAHLNSSLLFICFAMASHFFSRGMLASSMECSILRNCASSASLLGLLSASLQPHPRPHYIVHAPCHTQHIQNLQCTATYLVFGDLEWRAGQQWRQHITQEQHSPLLCKLCLHALALAFSSRQLQQVAMPGGALLPPEGSLDICHQLVHKMDEHGCQLLQTH